jgi:hypothetical protein
MPAGTAGASQAGGVPGAPPRSPAAGRLPGPGQRPLGLCTIRTRNEDMRCRTSMPVPAATRLHAASVTAACAASGPVGRSCAYGGREKPTTVSQPINSSSGAARGSATADVTVTKIATATSTPVAENRPCRAAAAVPMSSMPV